MDSKDEPLKPVSLTDRDPQGRFRPGNPAGPGRPRGRRSMMAELLDALADEEAEDIARAVLKLAREGEFRAVKFVLDRRWPKHRERPVPIALPPAQTATDLPKASAAILDAAAAGELAPGEAVALAAAPNPRFRRSREAAQGARSAVGEEGMSGSKEARMRWLKRHRVASPERVKHWILVPPTLPEAELDGARRGALAKRGITFRETDELIFQDFWGAKEPVYYMSEPRGAEHPDTERLFFSRKSS